jgi:hypothetical protein
MTALTVLGGGKVSVMGGSLSNTQLIESYPSPSTTWSATGIISGALGGCNRMQVHAYVIARRSACRPDRTS